MSVGSFGFICFHHLSLDVIVLSRFVGWLMLGVGSLGMVVATALAVGQDPLSLGGVACWVGILVGALTAALAACFLADGERER